MNTFIIVFCVKEKFLDTNYDINSLVILLKMFFVVAIVEFTKLYNLQFLPTDKTQDKQI